MDWYTNTNHKKRNSLNNNNFAGLNLNSTINNNNNSNNFNGRSSEQTSPATPYSSLNNTQNNNFNNIYSNYSMKHHHQHQQQQQQQQSPYTQTNQTLQPPYHINSSGRSPNQISTSPSNMATPTGFASSSMNSLSNTPMINAYISSTNSSSIPISNPNSAIPNFMPSSNSTQMLTTTPIERTSYYFSQLPLFTCDWTTINNNSLNYVALGSYKEGFTNKLEIVQGTNYDQDTQYSQQHSLQHQSHLPSSSSSSSSITQDNSNLLNGSNGYYDEYDSNSSEGFLFQKIAETNLNYPITHLKWDPSMLKYTNQNAQRLAASSEVLRLYKLNESVNENDYNLVQTHILANNAATNTTKLSLLHDNEINTLPPVTSFDWNTTDPNILITSSVDTTCTVWDLNRSHPYDNFTDTAVVKTQLIAHDSEVFDVKFIHKSTNVFVSVGNDGSMRVFDLRSLEHSTIIYEPQPETTTPKSSKPLQVQGLHSSNFNSKALLKLSASNIDQHHLATIGVNSNQIIIIDMRMPGIPMAMIDGSINNPNYPSASINSISWHPTSNYLLSGGDDCQALVWDINNLNNNPNNSSYTNSSSSSSLSNGNNGNNNNVGNGNDSTNSSGSSSNGSGIIIDTPVLAYEEDLEVNNVCWKQNSGDYMGVVSGKGFQAVKI
ncbi:hypothetical protein KGF54_004660 [Candida jiufengensis]|uniref:uncharacterized protein n=1 Tax=Candida jiufengensis TaxID=497108 RepID=UPI0022251777|nr:uncharacterized protein KGF54_004660 [Candida jiufengensis]KAI5951586.1 hypothetical protein KGF54_004660 [Candida jiufengensis]